MAKTTRDIASSAKLSRAVRRRPEPSAISHHRQCRRERFRDWRHPALKRGANGKWNENRRAAKWSDLEPI